MFAKLKKCAWFLLKVFGIGIISAAICIGGLYSQLPLINEKIDLITAEQSKMASFAEQLTDFETQLKSASNSIVTLQLLNDEIEKDKQLTNEKLAGISRSTTQWQTHYQDRVETLASQLEQLSTQFTQVKRLADSKPSNSQKNISQPQQILPSAPRICCSTVHSSRHPTSRNAVARCRRPTQC